MNLVVLGAQWGDEGKGKIVNLLTPNFSIVSYQGGRDAGHAVYVKGTKVRAAADSGSGILHPGVAVRGWATAWSSIRRRCLRESTS